MANNLNAIISADTTGLKKSISEAKDLLGQYTKQTKASGTATDTITRDQVNSYKRVVKQLERTNEGNKKAQASQKALSKQVEALKNQWNSLSDAAKNSKFGKSLSDTTKSAEKELKNLNSEIKNTKNEVKSLGDATKGVKFDFSSIKSSINSLVSGDISGLKNSVQGMIGTFQQLGTTGVSGLTSGLSGLATSLGTTSAAATTAGASFAGMGAAATAALGPIGLIAGAIAAAGVAIFKGVQESEKWKESMNIFGTTTNMSSEQLKNLGDGLRQLSTGFRASSDQILQTATYITQMSPALKTSEADLLKATKAAQTLAEGAMVPAKDAAQALTAVLNTMGVSVSESTNVVNALAFAQKNSAASVSYLGTAIQASGVGATAAGMSYYQLIAALSVLAPEFNDAGACGASLNKVLIGLETTNNAQLKPSVVGLTAALQNLAKQNMTDAELARIVGEENVKTARCLMENSVSADELTNSMKGTQTAEEGLNKTNETILGSLGKLWNSLKELIRVLVELPGPIKMCVDSFKLLIKTLNAVVEAATWTAKKVGGMFDWMGKKAKGAWNSMFGSSKINEDIKKTQDAIRQTGDKIKKMASDISGAGNTATQAASQSSKAADILKSKSQRLAEEIRRCTDELNKMSAAERNTAKGQELKKHLEDVRKQLIENSNAYSELTKAREQAAKKDSALAGATKGKGWLAGLGKDALVATTGIGSAMAAITMTVGAIKSGIETCSGFNKSFSTLQAVSGKSATELALLKKQALELGSATRYSASEIMSLQIELAKLGFDDSQIYKMTKSIQNLATATGAELSEAASLAGSSLRIFGMDASETQRIADVLSKSCSSSALNFSFLATAMSTLGPVANAMGFSIEDTVGLLGTLANAGFDASSAATAARNIILKLADANSDLSKSLGGPVRSGAELMDALVKLRETGIDLAGALELTDDRSVAAFNTLLDGAESAKTLMSTLTDCTGAAQEMSDVMSDNLEGDVASLNSAWEGLMLSLGNGQSILRDIVQWLTKVVQWVNHSIEVISAWATELYNDSAVVRGILAFLVKGFEDAFNAIVFIVKQAMTSIKSTFKILGALLKGDIKGALAAYKEGLKESFGNTTQYANKAAKNWQNAWDKTINGHIDKKAEPEAPGDTGTTTTKKTRKTPTKKPGTSGDKGGKGGTSTKKTYEKGSIGYIEQQISEQQEKLKSATTNELRQAIQTEITKLQKQKEELELSLKAKLDEKSLDGLDKLISEKQTELKMAISDEDRARIQTELDELTGKKEIIELHLKPVVQGKDIDKLESELADHDVEVKARVVAQATTDRPKSKSDKAQKGADNLKSDLDFNQKITKSIQEQYNAIQKKLATGGKLTADEEKLCSIYEEAKKRVDELSSSYTKAAGEAAKLKTNAEFKKSVYNGITGTIDGLGNLNSSIQGVGSTWTNLTENWEDMSTFEKITQGFGAVISTIQSMISIYETINEVVQLFGAISEAAAARKVAANTAEMASDTALTATETANTTTKIANDTAENTSEIGKLGVKEAGAIAGATSSGAALPFPANIAAIAAGIAAVVAGFAMVFSCFADGGIVQGGSSIGDYNIARVNSGEMILNGTQQKRLFNLLNGQGGVVQSGVPSGKVDFRIKGNALKGVLKNYDKKRSKI